MTNQYPYFFYLGGEDNEMVEIKKVLKRLSIPYYQPQKRWGDIVIKRSNLINLSTHKQVFVECRPETMDTEFIIIDHHRQMAENPASILQVLDLFKIRPTLRQKLIASIDSDFLGPTINKYPDHKQKIWKIFQSGYRKNFESTKDYLNFKKKCKELIENADVINPNFLIVYNAPSSMNLIAGLCDMQNISCIITVGDKNSNDLKPCFYLGENHMVKKLSDQNFFKSYWGKRYFGCREVPNKFVNLVINLLI